MKGEFQGTPFRVAPKVDQTKVYDAVFEKLSSGGCIGIFPEGGSHDRTELLPLKGEFCHIFLPCSRLTL
jgi:glycerol-3-phosphate O-acyltransferase/dihydroxyacetone phosphate acyltransferase